MVEMVEKALDIRIQNQFTFFTHPRRQRVHASWHPARRNPYENDEVPLVDRVEDRHHRC